MKILPERLSHLEQYIHDVDCVLIESQEASVDKIRGFSFCIGTYFHTKGYHVEWSSGGVKLRVFKGKVTWTVPKTTDKYKIRKFLAVQHTKAILAQESEHNESFKEYYKDLIERENKKEKIDDRCDCFLQALYFIVNKNLKI